MRDGAVSATLLGYSSADVPALLPRRAAQSVNWQWKDGAFVRSDAAGAGASEAAAASARPGPTRARHASLRVRAVHLDPVRNATHMDAVARALLRGVHDIAQQRQRHGRRRARVLQQLVVRRSSRRPDRRCPARRPRARTGHRSRPRCTGPGRSRPPEPRRQSRPLLHGHLSCRFLRRYANWQVAPALTGVEQFDDTTGRFPMLLGGYSPGVRECARVKIGHTPTVFVI